MSSELKRVEKDFIVLVDKDDGLGYEVRSPVLEALRIPVIAILNILPERLAKTVFTAFSGKYGYTRTVRRWATTFKALEVMYTYPERRKRDETNLSDRFWENFLNNALSLRNRLKLTIREVINAIQNAAQGRETVHLLSLGSGSSRAIIETLVQLNHRINLKAKLIDRSRTAIAFSHRLASSNDVVVHMEWHRDDVQNLNRYCGQDFCPEVVEMVGLLDYYSKEESIDLVNKIYQALSSGGWLISCNVLSNREQPFITKGVGWPLIYKTPQELGEIMIAAGFSAQSVRLVCEPLKVHCLTIGQKFVQL